jgi:hypothetical protein
MLKTGYVATTQRHVFGVVIGLAFCRSIAAPLGSTINLKKNIWRDSVLFTTVRNWQFALYLFNASWK